ncbi:MAG: pentapeptide repeat-containing protein [Gammaproteobacteria bacterium]|nr:pentapeptide repeat-containing protein [Gammaproteobacteria bacterium]
MAQLEIKHRYTGAVLYSAKTGSRKEAVEAALKSGAYLGGADLGGAYLDGADLGGADLRGAYLRGAYLRGASRGGADLGGANLRGAYLGGADLGGAYLGGAYLRGAYLGGAKTCDSDGTPLVLTGSRPIIQIGPIGSRRDYLLAWITDRGVYVRAGCFWDTLNRFREAVAETHGEGVHAREYQAAIALIECHASLWAPVATPVEEPTA